jgi:hypothetical protein
MKFRITTIIAFLFLWAIQPAIAQKPAAKSAAAKGSPSSMTAGMGITWIDNKPYYLISLAPELSFGKFGVGLDLNLRFSSQDQKLRKEDFDETYDYIRIIRYLRWGQKGDEIYARLGALDYSRIGHGFIMYLYKNSPSFEDRRTGVEFDLNFGKYGFETVYSDFARAGVFGLRGYVRPLQYTSISSVPVLGAMEVGATWAGDFRANSKDIKVDTAGGIARTRNDGTINIIGVDIGFPLVRLPMVSSTFYVDFAKILSFGSGVALGLETNFFGLGIFDIYTKIERRYTGDQFMANYFDAMYEIDRYQLAGLSLSSKARTLSNLASPGPGYFGDLTVGILGTLQVRGMYQKLDRDSKSGMLHLGTTTGTLIPMIVIDAGYDKKYIQNNKDIFNLDDRSFLYASIGYKP